jgi:hypothetical protein
MIRAKCKPDGPTWPPSFAALPRIGDKVVSKEGTVGVIESITHTTTTSFDKAMNRTYEMPCIIVELTGVEDGN